MTEKLAQVSVTPINCTYFWLFRSEYLQNSNRILFAVCFRFDSVIASCSPRSVPPLNYTVLCWDDYDASADIGDTDKQIIRE